MAATQALRELIDSGLAASDIAKITISVPPPHLKMIGHGVKGHDRASHLTSLPYQMAIAALQPENRFDISQSPGAIPETLQSFMALIEVCGDETLLADYPAVWPARVAIRAASGPQERLVRHVPGDPERPLTEMDITRKFHALVAPMMGDQGARRMLQLAKAALQSPDAVSGIMQELNKIDAASKNGIMQ
jgi:2-methylcitrate dehydratase PrpD